MRGRGEQRVESMSHSHRTARHGTGRPQIRCAVAHHSPAVRRHGLPLTAVSVPVPLSLPPFCHLSGTDLIAVADRDRNRIGTERNRHRRAHCAVRLVQQRGAIAKRRRAAPDTATDRAPPPTLNGSTQQLGKQEEAKSDDCKQIAGLERGARERAKIDAAGGTNI